ncbi:unnamed protein product [Rhizoctonia solani]|uniref:F-box domain-containing protein n=1 Tax=Rhizoctonia solani TaxID=456999 RepID=A0A8H3HMS2_9AGAM|nr:unnamed protein product [Rhizoctonia solani]
MGSNHHICYSRIVHREPDISTSTARQNPTSVRGETSFLARENFPYWTMSANDVDYQLPTETLHRIFRFVDPNGLAAICLVSHRTRAIVEPILYNSPRADCETKVLLLARTLLARSDLAHHVKCLLLSLDASDAGDGLGTRYLPSLLRKIRLLFERGNLQNLRELCWYARGETGWALPNSKNPLPRLTRFSTTASSPSLVSFFSAHPSITRLTLHSHGLALRLPADALPRLTHIACAASALASLPVRKLKHVVLTDAPFIPLLGGEVLSALGGDRSHRGFARGWRDASPAPDHVDSLRSITLCLGHVILSPSQAPLILEPFTRHVSALKKLGIVAGPSFFRRAILESLTPVLEGFTELETIHMECNAEPDSPILVGALSSGCISPEGECSPRGTRTTLEGMPAIEGIHNPLGNGSCPPTAEETRVIIQAWRDACPSIENVRLPWWTSGRARAA